MYSSQITLKTTTAAATIAVYCTNISALTLYLVAIEKCRGNDGGGGGMVVGARKGIPNTKAVKHVARLSGSSFFIE